jgi:hypothetical protein
LSLVRFAIKAGAREADATDYDEQGVDTDFELHNWSLSEHPFAEIIDVETAAAIIWTTVAA